jgi:hypothetical protein
MVSRIVRLTLDDIICEGDQVMLRLGEPPSPVPTPVAQLLLAWINERDNMNTATNPHSRWLFPGVPPTFRIADLIRSAIRNVGGTPIRWC